MAPGADKLVPFAILLFSTLVAVLVAIVALIRSDRVPGPAATRGTPPSHPGHK